MQLLGEDSDGKLRLISALSTVAVTHPPKQPNGRQLHMYSWKSLHIACWSKGGKKGPCPPNTGDLCFSYVLLRMMTDMQRGRRSLLHAPPPSAQLTSRGLIRPPLFFPSFIFLFCSLRSQTLKIRTLKNNCICKENQKVTMRAQGKAQVQKRSEKTLSLHLSLTHGTETAYNTTNKNNKNSNKNQQTLGNRRN